MNGAPERITERDIATEREPVWCACFQAWQPDRSLCDRTNCTDITTDRHGDEPDDDQCCTRPENKWNPATWCGCQH